MTSCRPPLFHKRWFEPTVIVTCVRFYLRFALSLRDVKELIADSGEENSRFRSDLDNLSSSGKPSSFMLNY
jgi:hypothetical protein